MRDCTVLYIGCYCKTVEGVCGPFFVTPTSTRGRYQLTPRSLVSGAENPPSLPSRQVYEAGKVPSHHSYVSDAYGAKEEE